MKKNAGRTDFAIGIDIGSSFLRMAQVARGHAVKTACEALPSGLSGEALDSFLAGAIKRLVAANKFRKAPVILSIPQSESCVRMVTVPSMPADQLPPAVKWAAKQFVPYPPEETVLGFSVAGEITEGGGKKLKVVFMAVTTSVFQRYLALVAKAGFRVASFHTGCFALANIVSLSGTAPKGADVLIDIGHQTVDITFFKDQKMVFTRSVPVGEGHLDEIMKDRYGMQAEEILALKKTHGIVLSGADPETASYAGASAEYVELLLQECRLSFGHYSQISHGDEVSRIAVCGTGALLKNLPDALAQKLFMPVTILGAPAPYIVEGDFSSFATAVGLTLETGSNPDLIAAHKARDGKKGFLSGEPMLQKVAAGLVALVILPVAGLGGMNVYYTRQLQALQQELTGLDEKTIQIMSVQRRVSRLRLQKEGFTRLVGRHPSWSEMLARLTKIIDPGQVELESVSLDLLKDGVKTLVLQGQITGQDEENLSGVLDKMIGYLQETKYFKKVIPDMRESAGNGSEGKTLIFSLECQIDAE